MSKKKELNNQINVPIVAILGHVDHGKTSLLDYIRKTNVQAKEVGGITQKISVFTIEPKENNYLTFIDTPGHETFDLMRQRGGSVADVALLIVAADDGVQPQTIESVEIINNSTVKPIVVITKKDISNSNTEKIKRDLANRGLLVEGMGGSVPVVETSTKTGEGVDELIDMINLVLEVEGLKEAEELPKGVSGKGFVLESVKDKSRGYVVSIVVVEGSFKVGNWFAYSFGNDVFLERIKAFVSEEEEAMKTLDKGFGGKIIGLSNLVELGAQGYCLDKKDEKLANELLTNDVEDEEPEVQQDEVESESQEEDSEFLKEFFEDQEDKGEEIKAFSVILKASSEGALEAIKKSLKKVNIEGVRIEIAHSDVGNVSIKDVETASITKSIILGFEIGMEKGVEDLAQKKKVFIKNYEVIYKLIDDIKEAASSLVEPEEVEEEIGKAEVKAIIELSDGSKIVGGKCKDGVLKKGEKAYVVRNDEIITEGKIVSMKHNKDDVKEISKNYEFGISLDNSVDEVIPGDTLHCFKVSK